MSNFDSKQDYLENFILQNENNNDNQLQDLKYKFSLLKKLDRSLQNTRNVPDKKLRNGYYKDVSQFWKKLPPKYVEII